MASSTLRAGVGLGVAAATGGWGGVVNVVEGLDGGPTCAGAPGGWVVAVAAAHEEQGGERGGEQTGGKGHGADCSAGVNHRLRRKLQEPRTGI